MSLNLTEITKTPFVTIPTDDGKYQFIFFRNGEDCTAKGLPRHISHRLVNAETGATLVGGNMFPVPSSWELPDLQAKMLKVLRDASARMFFKTVARKVDLWTPWEYHDHDALREHAPRYVYMEEVIRRFYKEVLGKEYVRRTPQEGESFFHRVKCTENIRGSYKDYTIHVHRELELFCPSSNLVNLRGMYVSCEFAAPFLVGSKDRNANQLSMRFEYPIDKWPGLKAFLAEPRVEAVLDAWIAAAWSEEQRVQAKNPNARESPNAVFMAKEVSEG
ncbi:hypothetical protein pEaSNUABM8_00119 [Erwinia phage pEa_SNUABM_8]|nr:hypothetical protein pEaSNUABM8_00119 [Erwinia phage pEa_SNUABM_8]QVW54871.1 hypothetical protein pEaSNUABM4_00118 [Erwinia phage pEa_SNUABM_4]